MDLQNLEIVEISNELTPFLNRYYYANQQLQQPFKLTVMPTCHAFFSNSFSGNPPGTEYTIDGKKVLRDSKWRLGGPVLNHQIQVYEPKELCIVFCVLKPTALFRLFGIYGDTIAGNNLCISKLAPEQAELARQCFTTDHCANKQVHLKEADKFFTELAVQAHDGDTLVEEAVRILENCNGALSVADLCKQVDANHRTLYRKFKKIVGLPPKYFSKLLQINWVVGNLLSNDQAVLSEIALEAGFFDQAHFSKVLGAFFQHSPKAFIDSQHVELATYFSALNKTGQIIALKN